MNSTNSIPYEEGKNTIFYESALAYAKVFNWPIFPLLPGKKSPIYEGGFHKSTTEEAQITEWWKAYPGANIGLPTGERSGLLVLDVDPRNGGEESLERLIETYGSLPDTVTCLTAGGGQHYYFKYDERITKSKLSGYDGLDLQSNGKYVVLPPSIHPNGKRYEWELSSRPGEIPIATIPEWLVKAQGQTTDSDKKPMEHWKGVLKGIAEGGRNEATASLSGHLLRRRIHPIIAHELISSWNMQRNDPPLDQEEVDRTFNSILNKEVERLRGRA